MSGVFFWDTLYKLAESSFIRMRLRSKTPTAPYGPTFPKAKLILTEYNTASRIDRPCLPATQRCSMANSTPCSLLSNGWQCWPVWSWRAPAIRHCLAPSISLHAHPVTHYYRTADIIITDPYTHSLAERPIWTCRQSHRHWCCRINLLF